MKNYGSELILDIHEVKNTNLFTRKHISDFMVQLLRQMGKPICIFLI